jgi:hypothetical protein
MRVNERQSRVFAEPQIAGLPRHSATLENQSRCARTLFKLRTLRTLRAARHSAGTSGREAKAELLGDAPDEKADADAHEPARLARAARVVDVRLSARADAQLGLHRTQRRRSRYRGGRRSERTAQHDGVCGMRMGGPFRVVPLAASVSCSRQQGWLARNDRKIEPHATRIAHVPSHSSMQGHLQNNAQIAKEEKEDVRFRISPHIAQLRSRDVAVGARCACRRLRRQRPARCFAKRGSRERS